MLDVTIIRFIRSYHKQKKPFKITLPLTLYTFNYRSHLLGVVTNTLTDARLQSINFRTLIQKTKRLDGQTQRHRNFKGRFGRHLERCLDSLISD